MGFAPAFGTLLDENKYINNDVGQANGLFGFILFVPFLPKLHDFL